MSKALFCTFGIFKIPAAADWVYKRGNTATCDGILHWPDSWSKIWFKSALWAHQRHGKGSQSVLKHWAEQCAASTGKIQTCWMRQSKTKKHLNTSIPCPVVSLHWGGGSNSSPAVLLWIQPVSFWMTSSCWQSWGPWEHLSLTSEAQLCIATQLLHTSYSRSSWDLLSLLRLHTSYPTVTKLHNKLFLFL